MPSASITSEKFVPILGKYLRSAPQRNVSNLFRRSLYSLDYLALCESSNKFRETTPIWRSTWSSQAIERLRYVCVGLRNWHNRKRLTYPSRRTRWRCTRLIPALSRCSLFPHLSLAPTHNCCYASYLISRVFVSLWARKHWTTFCVRAYVPVVAFSRQNSEYYIKERDKETKGRVRGDRRLVMATETQRSRVSLHCIFTYGICASHNCTHVSSQCPTCSQQLASESKPPTSLSFYQHSV